MENTKDQSDNENFFRYYLINNSFSLLKLVKTQSLKAEQTFYYLSLYIIFLFYQTLSKQ